MSSQGLHDDIKNATIKNHLRGHVAQDIIVPGSTSQSESVSLSPTPGRNLSTESSQSSYSRRRRLTSIYCDSVDNEICTTNSNIDLGSEGIFTPSSFLFNGAPPSGSVKSLVIRSIVQCNMPLCKMSFREFDLLQISGSGSLLGGDIQIDVNSFHVLQGGKVSGTARGGPSVGVDTSSTFSYAVGASHGGKGGYWSVTPIMPGDVYGSETLPTDFGGGGTTSAGGGRISINATIKVEVDGNVSEDGGDCTETILCASPSGGSIYISSEKVLGTGRISANGGALALSSTYLVASGAGGRIAIYTNDASPWLTVSVSGGYLNNNTNNLLPFHAQGETGTIFRGKFLPPPSKKTDVSFDCITCHSANRNTFIPLITSSYEHNHAKVSYNATNILANKYSHNATNILANEYSYNTTSTLVDPPISRHPIFQPSNIRRSHNDQRQRIRSSL
jgi:hypothetical protein